MNVEVRPGLDSDERLSGMPAIARVGVIGAGQMGNGIAHVCALAGFSVVLSDIKEEALQKAMAVMARNMARQVNRSLIRAEDKIDALARITTTTDFPAFSECDFVIEAATEKEEIKKNIFAALTPHLKQSCMLASNTSSISITRLGAATDRPEKFIGMHFMNPVPVMKLVEIIRGIATDEPTFQAVQAVANKLAKITAVSEDFPAFIVNRILVPMINEAVYALYEGLSDSKYRPCPLLVKYVEAGWLGRKTGKGFYDYGQNPPRPTR